MASTTSKELSQWMAFFAVREERDAQARKEKADDDGETYHWGTPRSGDNEE